MSAIMERGIGGFSVDLELTNDEDLIRAVAGLISPEQVRRVRVRGVADGGVTRLIIPESIAHQLGLEASETVQVRSADGGITERPIARGVDLACGGRDSIFSAVVDPGCEVPVIGRIVLEQLDFLIDFERQCLVPRDPKQIIVEIE